MSEASPKKPIEIFLSYSQKDEKLRQQLETHLATLQDQGLISTWNDRRITAGTEWQGAIDKHLNTARIILLLVSPDFIASPYCRDVELRRAMERHEKKEALVIPVILRPCDWGHTIFASLQVLPSNRRPVVRWTNRDEAFLDVVEGIRKALHADKGGASASPAAEAVPSSILAAGRALHQLPAPPADFTGRAEELVELLDAIRKSGVIISGLQGLGGVGKTALALKLAEQLRTDYPDAQFYLDLKGVSDKPLGTERGHGARDPSLPSGGTTS